MPQFNDVRKEASEVAVAAQIIMHLKLKAQYDKLKVSPPTSKDVWFKNLTN